MYSGYITMGSHGKFHIKFPNSEVRDWVQTHDPCLLGGRSNHYVPCAIRVRPMLIQMWKEEINLQST